MVLTMSAARQSIRFEAGSCFLADSICVSVIGVLCGPPRRTLRTAGVHVHDMYCNNGAHLIFNLLWAQAYYVFTFVVTSVQRGNSRKYTYVEVSGHNLESSQTWSFYLRFLPFYKILFSKLEFSSLIDSFVWISETIRVIWLSVRSFCFVYIYK